LVTHKSWRNLPLFVQVSPVPLAAVDSKIYYQLIGDKNE
jgi:hypothetical protein